MRKSFGSVLVAALFVCLGCEKKAAPVEKAAAVVSPAPAAPSPEAAAPKDEGTILLGEVGSLTGAEAAFGISTRDGIDLAIQEANAAGGVKGKKLEVRVYDDQSKPEEAASAATRLISQDHVKLILGEVASSNSLAMAPKAQEGRVPMISPSSTNEKVTEVGDYIFRVCFVDAFQGFVMAKYARESLKLTRAAILKDVKSAYSVGLTDVFQRKFSELGGKVVGVESYAKGDTDFRAQLTALKKLKPDGLYIPGYYSDVGVIARQAKELGLKVTMMGGDGWDSDKLFELGGSALEGSVVSNHYSAEDPSPQVQNFIARYKEKFGNVPDSLAALGYDAALVAIEALKRAPDLEGPSVREALAQIKEFQGVTGKITIDDKRNAVKPAVILSIKDGKFQFVASVAP